MSNKDLARVVLGLSADVTALKRDMARADQVVANSNQKMRRSTEQAAKGMERAMAQASTRIGQAGIGMAKSFMAPFLAMASARGAVALIDTSTRITNSLKVAGVAGEDLAMVYNRLFASAQRNAAPLETLAQLYGRVALVQGELGTSTEEMLRFTDNVALALRVAGTDAQSASGALLQLSQAMGSGVVRAEEFNSILEGALPIAQAAAAGLKEAGGSVAKLRQLVVDGKVSSEAFFRAFEAGAHTLEDKVANAELTVSQQFVRLQNVLEDTAKRMNEGSDAGKLLGGEISNLADIVQEMGEFVEYAVGPVKSLVGLFESGTEHARNFANEIAKIFGGDKGIGLAASKWINDRQIPGLSAHSITGRQVLEQTFSLLGATPQDEELARILGGGKPTEPLKITVEADKPAQISLEDYGLPTTPGKGGKSPGQRFNDSMADMRQRLANLNEETALRRQLGAATNDYGYALEKLRATQELENAARRAGIALGPEQRESIQGLAEDYALATASAARLTEQHAAATKQLDEMRDAAQSALDTIIDGFLEGKDAGEIFGSVLKDIGRQLLSMGTGSIANMLFPGAGGRPFADGGYTGPGGKYQPAGTVHKGEYVFSKEATQRAGVGNLEAMHRSLKGYASGGAVDMPQMRIPSIPQIAAKGGDTIKFEMPISIDARGADAAGLAKVQQQLAAMQAEMPGRMKQIVRERGHKWR